MLAFAVGIIFSQQTRGHMAMPVAACGSIDEIFIIGNTFDDKSGNLVASGIYVLDKGRYKISLYNNMTLIDSMSFEKIALDKDNNLFSIVRKQEGKAIYEIWKINNGIILDKYDITNLIDEKNNGGIQAFTIDGKGNFFIREIFGRGNRHR